MDEKITYCASIANLQRGINVSLPVTDLKLSTCLQQHLLRQVCERCVVLIFVCPKIFAPHTLKMSEK